MNFKFTLVYRESKMSEIIGSEYKWEKFKVKGLSYGATFFATYILLFITLSSMIDPAREKAGESAVSLISFVVGCFVSYFLSPHVYKRLILIRANSTQCPGCQVVFCYYPTHRFDLGTQQIWKREPNNELALYNQNSYHKIFTCTNCDHSHTGDRVHTQSEKI